MKSMIDQAFRRYGMTVTVEHGAETGETHGFVQPVTAVRGGGGGGSRSPSGRWARRIGAAGVISAARR